jgi:tetratricopeptide (TPR) repeat protein
LHYNNDAAYGDRTLKKSLIAILLLAQSLATIQPAAASRLVWQDYEQPGYEAALQGAYAKIEYVLLGKLEELNNSGKPDDKAIVSQLRRLISICLKQNKLDEAKTYLELAQTFAARSTNDALTDSSIADFAGELATKKGDYAEAQKYFEKALSLRNSAQDNSDSQTFELASRLAETYMRRGNSAQCREVLRVYTNDPAFATTAQPAALVRFAWCAAQRQRFPLAESLLRKAYSLDSDRYGDDQPGVAGELNDLAFVLAKQGRFQLAEENMQHAVGITRKYRYRDLPHWLNNLALILRNEKKPQYQELVAEAKALDKAHTARLLVKEGAQF